MEIFMALRSCASLGAGARWNGIDEGRECQALRRDGCGRPRVNERWLDRHGWSGRRSIIHGVNE
jgi:hypothetical protein